MPKKKQTQILPSKPAKKTDISQIPMPTKKTEHPQQKLEKDDLGDLLAGENPEEILERFKNQKGGE